MSSETLGELPCLGTVRLGEAGMEISVLAPAGSVSQWSVFPEGVISGVAPSASPVTMGPRACAQVPHRHNVSLQGWQHWRCGFKTTGTVLAVAGWLQSGTLYKLSLDRTSSSKHQQGSVHPAPSPCWSSLPLVCPRLRTSPFYSIGQEAGVTWDCPLILVWGGERS